MSRTLREALAVVAIGLLAADAGIARGGRGGGGQVSRGSARTSVNRPAGASSRQFNQNVDRNINSNVNRNINSNVNRNINSNVNRNINSNVNRNVNVNRDIDFDRDIDVDVHGGWGYGGCCYHPVATAAAVTAAAVTTAAVVGSVVHTIPSSCEAVSIEGFTYQRCGSTWYQPQFSGSTVDYIVVNPPQ